MRPLARAIFFAVLPAVLLLVAACSDDGDDEITPPVENATIHLRLDHVVDGTPLQLNAIQYANESGNQYSVKTLRYVISDVSLSSPLRRETAFDVAHLRDAEEDVTRTLTLSGVSPGDYDEISFTFGLDEEKNKDPDQGGTLPRTTDWEAMRWPPLWGGGYHYMMLEGDLATAGDPISFMTHTGRRHAQQDPTYGTDPQPVPHFFSVTIPTPGFHVGPGQTWAVTIWMDVNRWYADPDGAGAMEPYDLTDYPGNMMMNTDAQEILEAAGPGVFSLGGLELE